MKFVTTRVLAKNHKSDDQNLLRIPPFNAFRIVIFNRYIQKSLNFHENMHKMNKGSNFMFKCSKPNCLSTFTTESNLKTHLRIHNNELDNCQYCLYRYVAEINYRNHLNNHFRIKEHKCDICGEMFKSRVALTDHSSIHEGIIYCCLICPAYEVGKKSVMKMHLRKKHSDMLGSNINWETVKKYVKLK